jgi:hypothetical protein
MVLKKMYLHEDCNKETLSSDIRTRHQESSCRGDGGKNKFLPWTIRGEKKGGLPHPFPFSNYCDATLQINFSRRTGQKQTSEQLGCLILVLKLTAS